MVLPHVRRRRGPGAALTGAGYFCSAFGLGDLSRLGIATVILVAALAINHLGMRVTGGVQTAVVICILVVLAVTVGAGLSRSSPGASRPSCRTAGGASGLPRQSSSGASSGGRSPISRTSSGIPGSGDTRHPHRGRDRRCHLSRHGVRRGRLGKLRTYGVSDVSLVRLIKLTFGEYGARIGGVAALFVCVAPAIAYTGAVARLASSLSRNGYAPKFMSRMSPKHGSPSGGLAFLAACFFVLLSLFSSRLFNEHPHPDTERDIHPHLSAGSAAGLRLLKGNRLGIVASLISLVMTAAILLFVKWTAFMPWLLPWSGWSLR